MTTPLDDPTRLPVHDIMCIDCKSFYASVEAIRRGIHPLAADIAVLSKGDSPGGLAPVESQLQKALPRRTEYTPFSAKGRYAGRAC